MIVNSSAVIPVDALVFDAYGTLFDVQSVVTLAERLFPGHGAALSPLRRTEHQALQPAVLQLLGAPQLRQGGAEALGLSPQVAVRHRLLDAYLDLSPFP